MWSGEEDFKPLLQKALLKPSKGSLAAVTDVAVRDEKWCYKSVCFDLEKATKTVHKKQRLNVLYIVSDICRKSKSRLGTKDKYGARFQNILPLVLQRLDAAPLHHVVQAEKVLSKWRREGLFTPDALSEYERVLAKAKAKADAASQTQSSAVKDAQPEEQPIQAPELSPDTYDPFQTSLDDPSLEEPPIPDDINPPDDIDLPGPPPLVPSLNAAGSTLQLDSPCKRLKLSPQAAAKEAAEQSGSIARAQAIADRLAALADDPGNGGLPKSPMTVRGVRDQTGAGGLTAEQGSVPVSTAAGIPGVSTAEQQVQQQTSVAPETANIPKRRRASKFDQPAAEAQLPPPPQLSQPLPGLPPQPLPQLQSDISQESMRQKAQAIAAKFAANAKHDSAPGLMHSSVSSLRPAAKKFSAAGASAESEFDDDSDPFHGLPPVPPASAPLLPHVASSLPAQPHFLSHTMPPPVPKQPEQNSSRPELPPPPQPQAPRAWERDSLAAQQRVPQLLRGPSPGRPHVPPPRPPPPGPRPPPGAPPAHPPPQHYPHYPPQLHARPPPRPPPGGPAWHAPPPQGIPPHVGGWSQQTWGAAQGTWGAPPQQLGAPMTAQSEESRAAEDIAPPPPPPPLPSQTGAPAVY